MPAIQRVVVAVNMETRTLTVDVPDGLDPEERISRRAAAPIDPAGTG